VNKLVISIFLSLMLCVSAKASLPDSLLTERKAIELTLISPDTSLAIIQAMRLRKLVIEWRLDCLEAEYYINQRQYRRALPLFKKALADPALKTDSAALEMEIMMRLMYVCDKLSENDELTEYIYRLEKLAEKNNADFYKSHTLFMLGKQSFYQGNKTGLDKCQEAIEMMKNTSHPRKSNSLRTFYAEMLMMYQEEGRYNDAIRMSLLQEEIARIPSSIHMRCVDSRAMRLVYALRANLYAEMGDMDDADKAYDQWLKTCGGNPIDDKYIIGYLEAKGLYDDALAMIQAYKKHLSVERDSVSHWMLTMLGHESIIYGIQGRVDESLATARKIKLLTETLHQQEAREMMDTVYRFLQEKEEDSRNHLVYLSLGFIALFLILAAIASIFYTFYHLRHHRRTAESRVKRVTAATVEEVLTFQGGKVRIPVNELAKLYAYMDDLVTRERLFLKPNMNREELMRQLGIDKNRFGKMMTQYSGSNSISSYLNKKRAEYGAELLMAHPEFTISTIAEMSGMSSTVNFNRIFRSVYGVTPSEYRSNPDDANFEETSD